MTLAFTPFSVMLPRAVFCALALVERAWDRMGSFVRGFVWRRPRSLLSTLHSVDGSAGDACAQSTVGITVESVCAAEWRKRQWLCVPRVIFDFRKRLLSLWVISVLFIFFFSSYTMSLVFASLEIGSFTVEKKKKNSRQSHFKKRVLSENQTFTLRRGNGERESVM